MAAADEGETAAFEALVQRYGLDSAASEALMELWSRLSDDAQAPTAINGRCAVLEQHLADSLVGLEVPALVEAGTVADLGSGAGLPGLALAASLPRLEVRAIESQRSKCAYISSLAAAAGLANVRVVCARAEQWPEGMEANDAVVARALAAQPVVLEYAAPLLRLGGHLVEWRGRREQAEEAAADAAAAVLGLERLEVRRVKPFAAAEHRHLHVFVKRDATPARFPRRPGVAARRPLGG
jgi:16S rRNA (guanine527-N7)-methyltransferase